MEILDIPAQHMKHPNLYQQQGRLLQLPKFFPKHLMDRQHETDALKLDKLHEGSSLKMSNRRMCMENELQMGYLQRRQDSLK